MEKNCYAAPMLSNNCKNPFNVHSIVVCMIMSYTTHIIFTCVTEVTQDGLKQTIGVSSIKYIKSIYIIYSCIYVLILRIKINITRFECTNI